MTSERRPDGMFLRKLPEQQRIGRRLDLREILARARERFHHLRRGFARIGAPKTISPFRPLGLREFFCRLAMQFHKSCQRYGGRSHRGSKRLESLA